MTQYANQPKTSSTMISPIAQNDNYDYDEAETLLREKLYDLFALTLGNTDMSASIFWKFGEEEANAFKELANRSTKPNKKNYIENRVFNQFSRFMESLDTAVKSDAQAITSRMFFLPIAKNLKNIALTMTVRAAYVKKTMYKNDDGEHFTVSFSHTPKYHYMSLVKSETLEDDEIRTKTISMNKLMQKQFGEFQENLHEYYNSIVGLFFTAEGTWWEKFRNIVYPIYSNIIEGYVLDEDNRYRFAAMAELMNTDVKTAIAMCERFIDNTPNVPEVWNYIYNTFYKFKLITKDLTERQISAIMRKRSIVDKDTLKRAAVTPKMLQGDSITSDNAFQDRLKTTFMFTRRQVGDKPDDVVYYHKARTLMRFDDPDKSFMFDYRDIRQKTLNIPFPDTYTGENLLENLPKRIATLYDEIYENSDNKTDIENKGVLINNIFGEGVDVLALASIDVSSFKMYWAKNGVPSIGNSASLKSLILLRDLPKRTGGERHSGFMLDSVLGDPKEESTPSGIMIPVKPDTRSRDMENTILSNL